MHLTTLKNLERLKETFDALRPGKASLLTLLEEAELPESVYNSNAIENSTLTLQDTEKILLHQEIPPFHSQREVFEAVNLGRVTEYLNEKMTKGFTVNEDIILLVHGTLLSHIHDDCAGRFRKADEFVRVGPHVAPPPQQVADLMGQLLTAYHDESEHPLQRIINFHLEFERVHPFLDGNGRVGRALMNAQLKMHGYPPIIVRNKEKKYYYDALNEYDHDRSAKAFEYIVALLLKESLHKRIAYLQGDEIVLMSQIRREQPKFSLRNLGTLAKKQSLPAFRERGRWKIGRKMFAAWAEEP